MSERFKYFTNGVYRCENFVQQLAQNIFPELPIGTIGGVDEWFIVLEVIGNGTDAFPSIDSYNKPQVYIHCFFDILDKDGNSFQRSVVNSYHLPETRVIRGASLNITDILDKENEYLDNGTLVIEYGFQVVSILRNDGIWKFNLNDPFFNPDHTLKTEYGDSVKGPPEVFYGHKELIRFHSPLFLNEVNKFVPNWTSWLIEEVLQIAHGVRIPLDSLKVPLVAHHNKLRNVVQYADQQIVAFYWCPKITELTQSEVRLFENCMEFGLRHFLARLVDPYEGLKDLKDLIQQLDIETMSGEAMKTFAAKIFKLGT